MALRPTRKTDPAALALRARDVGDGQFVVENDHDKLCDFDREYVAFGTYFGTHGPHVFAAAPELLAAAIKAEALLTKLAEGGVYLEPGALRLTRDAIAKARGQ